MKMSYQGWLIFPSYTVKFSFEKIEIKTETCCHNLLPLFLDCMAPTTVQSVFRELVFRGRSGFRGLRFLKREFSRAKRIWIQRTVWIQGPRMPTRRLFSKSRLSCIFMVDLKSKNIRMGTHQGQNPQFFKMPEFRPFLRV